VNELNPKDLIDRVAEQELFTQLLAEESPARMLTIRDGGGRGKSSLLLRLRYNCQHEIKPPVASSLISLDQLGDPSPFAFLSKVIQGVALRGEKVRDAFAKFNSLDEARTSKNFTPFLNAAAPGGWRDRPFSGHAEVIRMEGGTNIGVQQKQEIHAETAYFEPAPRDQFTDEQEQIARERCIEAFFDDLRTITATRPLVLLLDSWERCNLGLRNWIREELVGQHLLNPDAGFRPKNFALVIAGRPRDPLRTPVGLRDDEFAEFFDTTDDMRATVRSIASLSEWDLEHVRGFMTLNGYAEPDEIDVTTLKTRLAKGWPLEKILTLLEAMRPEQGTG